MPISSRLCLGYRLQATTNRKYTQNGFKQHLPTIVSRSKTPNSNPPPCNCRPTLQNPEAEYVERVVSSQQSQHITTTQPTTGYFDA